MQINTQKPVHIYPNLKTTSKEEILKICKEFQVTLVDVAQDNAVEAGVSDLLRENGFKVIGPSRNAGQIEWDKAWSRDFMVKHHLPIPIYRVCNFQEEGIEYLKTQPDQPWFIKASGLAEGKGVIPAKSNLEAQTAIEEMSKFGTSGGTFLIEQALFGEEFSAFIIADQNGYQFLGNAQDHKRANDGDMGPNTGGMGCSSPPLIVDEDIKKQVDLIIQTTINGLKADGLTYHGVLYLGGMVVSGKVFIIEFNARWGDPEVECILPGIENDWFEVALAVADNNLSSLQIKHDGKFRIAVAAASKGYPGDYSRVKEKEIVGLKELINTAGIKVYGAGVKRTTRQLNPERAEGVIEYVYTANGGRLFYVVAEGKDVIEAREKAYSALKKVSIPGESGENLLHYRKDIGYRDVRRLESKI